MGQKGKKLDIRNLDEVDFDNLILSRFDGEWKVHTRTDNLIEFAIDHLSKALESDQVDEDELKDLILEELISN